MGPKLINHLTFYTIICFNVVQTIKNYFFEIWQQYKNVYKICECKVEVYHNYVKTLKVNVKWILGH